MVRIGDMLPADSWCILFVVNTDGGGNMTGRQDLPNFSAGRVCSYRMGRFHAPIINFSLLLAHSHVISDWLAPAA